MKGYPLISIAMCTYNGEKYLCEQLDSIVYQEYPNLELVVVDDCSTDGSFPLLEEYQRRFEWIKLYKNAENKGFNRNFEHALSLCTGAYIAIADQDDIWTLDKIKILSINIKDNLLLYHDSEIIDEHGTLTGKKMSDGHRFIRGQSEEYLLYNNSISGHALLFSRELLSYIPPFPNEIYYDWWIVYTAACMARIDYVDKCLVKHRRHGLNSTSKEHKADREYHIKNLMLFQAHPLTGTSTMFLIDGLLKGYMELKQQFFSFSLFSLLVKNQKSLFYTRKKSLFSKVKFIIRECSGQLRSN